MSVISNQLLCASVNVILKDRITKPRVISNSRDIKVLEFLFLRPCVSKIKKRISDQQLQRSKAFCSPVIFKPLEYYSTLGKCLLNLIFGEALVKLSYRDAKFLKGFVRCQESTR